MKYTYPCFFELIDEDAYKDIKYAAYFPDFDVTAYGESFDDTIENAKGLLKRTISVMLEDEKFFPEISDYVFNTKVLIQCFQHRYL